MVFLLGAYVTPSFVIAAVRDFPQVFLSAASAAAACLLWPPQMACLPSFGNSARLYHPTSFACSGQLRVALESRAHLKALRAARRLGFVERAVVVPRGITNGYI